MTVYACLDCGRPYGGPAEYRCPDCGGVYGIPAGIQFDPKSINPSLPGIWRYRDSFGLTSGAPNLYRGEGDTPLVEISLEGSWLYLKLESLNPSGSYKDRLAAVMVSQLAGMGIYQAVEDSSGNAGAAFAAYCAHAGIGAKVYVPESAAGPKREQIARFGAEVTAVPGPRQAAADAVLAEVEKGAVYASHAYQPHGLAGVATIAYELVDQLGGVPGMVIAPVGHGGLLLGIVLGFQALLAAGLIEMLPKFIGVQAAMNAPIWAAANVVEFVPGSTVAGGIAVTCPVRGPELLDLSRRGLVDFVVVSEEAIQEGREELAAQGIDAELTSAIVADAYRQLIAYGKLPEKGDVVAILSGHGLKQ
ncbi:MAG: pyridoxal-phosphate dependent enzyme [Anaerolineales bacterium]